MVKRRNRAINGGDRGLGREDWSVNGSQALKFGDDATALREQVGDRVGELALPGLAIGTIAAVIKFPSLF